MASAADRKALWWDFRRSPAAARILVELGADHGLSSSQCLTGTGLLAADLHDSDTAVEAGQELTVARNLIARLGDQPGLGAEAGRRYTFGSLGVWQFALLTSPRRTGRPSTRSSPIRSR